MRSSFKARLFPKQFFASAAVVIICRGVRLSLKTSRPLMMSKRSRTGKLEAIALFMRLGPGPGKQAQVLS